MAKFVEKCYTEEDIVSEEFPQKEACHIPVVLARNASGKHLIGGEYVKLKKVFTEYHITHISGGMGDYMVYPFIKDSVLSGEYCYVILNPNLLKDISHTFNIKFLDAGLK